MEWGTLEKYPSIWKFLTFSDIIQCHGQALCFIKEILIGFAKNLSTSTILYIKLCTRPSNYAHRTRLRTCDIHTLLTPVLALRSKLNYKLGCVIRIQQFQLNTQVSIKHNILLYPSTTANQILHTHWNHQVNIINPASKKSTGRCMVSDHSVFAAVSQANESQMYSGWR